MPMKNHDEIFQELLAEFPGLMAYILDGHLEEVGKLVEKMRFLNDGIVSATARLQEASHEATKFALCNKKYEELIRRIGLMLDREQLNEPDRTDHDLVSCAMPVTVALDLMKIARPLIVAKGEEELQMNENRDVFPVRPVDPSLFALHQNGKISDSTVLKMLMGVGLGLAKDEKVVAPVVHQEGLSRPGVFIEQAHRLNSFAVEYPAKPKLDRTLVDLHRLADAILAKFGWACHDISVNGRGGQGVSVEVVASELDGIATSISAPAFEQEFRAGANRILPASCYIDEIIIRSSRGGRPVLLPDEVDPTFVAYAGKKVKW